MVGMKHVAQFVDNHEIENLAGHLCQPERQGHDAMTTHGAPLSFGVSYHDPFRVKVQLSRAAFEYPERSPDHFREEVVPDGQSRFMIVNLSGRSDHDCLIMVDEDFFTARTGRTSFDDDPVKEAVKKNDRTFVFFAAIRPVATGADDCLSELLESGVDPSPVAVKDFPDLFRRCSTWNFQVESPVQPLGGGVEGESVSDGRAVVRNLDSKLFREKIGRFFQCIRDFCPGQFPDPSLRYYVPARMFGGKRLEIQIQKIVWPQNLRNRKADPNCWVNSECMGVWC